MTTPVSSILLLSGREALGPVDFAARFARPGQPMEVDMGCGKGRFLLARAAAHPEVNFLGVDRLLGRLRKIDRKAQRMGLTNIRLLRFDAYYAATYLIPAGSVRAYYVFFPDPWPKVRHHRHRLFNEPFMDALARTLVSGGFVHAATDHMPYFHEIARILTSDARFALEPALRPSDDERTDFERLFRGARAIGRCSVRLR
ncbi:MAG: tRNA (guanosine(46)-N7)-methyltransferase TrmB [Kiritimatiellae bacterium]|nr:tRNA (guanosine(46)-N7)-methyltransferase TrmB [Kiritimatiellia bacterium]